MLYIVEQAVRRDLLQDSLLHLEVVHKPRETQTTALHGFFVGVRQARTDQVHGLTDVVKLVLTEILTAVGWYGQGATLGGDGEEVEVHETGGDTSLWYGKTNDGKLFVKQQHQPIKTTQAKTWILDRHDTMSRNHERTEQLREHSRNTKLH